MTKKIWYEMVNMKYGEIYLSKYLSLQRLYKRIFNIITLIVSLSGILGWKFFENYVWIAFLLIAILQLIVLIKTEIINSDKGIEDISTLKMMYTRYFLKLEKLWTKNQYNQMTDKDAMDEYFELRESDWEKIQELDSRINIRKIKTLMKETETETNHYLNKYHYHE